MISFIITNYNKTKYISSILDVLEQLRNQFEIEIIIVDDFSEKDELLKLKEIVKRYRCSVFYNNKNIGAAGSRNIGIKKSIGEYICFIDSDSIISLESLKFLILGLKDYDIVFPKALYIDNTPLNPTNNFEKQYCLNTICFIIKRTKLNIMTYYFDEDMNIYCEDVDFFLRANHYGLSIYYNHKSIIYHPIINEMTLNGFYFRFRNSLYLALKSIGLINYKYPWLIYIFFNMGQFLLMVVTKKQLSGSKKMFIKESRLSLFFKYLSAFMWLISNFNLIIEKRKYLVERSEK